MARLITFLFIFFYSFNLLSEELKSDEKMLFNFFDLNNNKVISLDEINKAIKLIFQLTDVNQDGSLSADEIIELKKIIETFS